MKKITTLILAIVAACGTTFASAPTNQSTCFESPKLIQQKSEKPAVTVYYFHATRRCATCEAVENVTQKAIKEYYGEKVAFVSINREENNNNPLISKHKVSGQTLLVIQGDKAVNLTTDAFMNARTKPDKLKKKLKSTIDAML